MNFGNFGFGEILIILVIVLLLFGAKRIRRSRLTRKRHQRIQAQPQ
jgi:Sec-independent protein translocase protein TatA